MRVQLAFSFALAALVGACPQPNPDHCANQQGDASCKAKNIDTPYCSRCTADNNGCVADPVTDSTCEVGSTSVGESSNPTTTPTTSTSDQTSTSSTSTTSTSEPVTSSTSSTTVTTDPTTGDTSTSTGDTSTSTGDTSTGTTAMTDTGSETSTGTTDATSTTSTDSSTGTTDGTTMDGPMCGDNLQEDPEICDGTDLNGLNCPLKNMTKYGGGLLKCSMNCMAYDETQCCLAQGQTCQMNQGQVCCPGTSCKALGCGLETCCKP